ncbi:MAG: rhodanese-like domain-containing protein, partial [Deltaproteobacteria bacterium]|nr:rhodanese-like domain-containing protein [Deltaproteobacteria bacterium]
MASLLERFEESSLLTVIFAVTAAAAVIVAVLETGFTVRSLDIYELVLVVILSVPAGFLFFVSLTDLILYFEFIPSISDDGHLFARVHGTHLIHPLITSVLLGLAVVCLLTGSLFGWLLWGGALGIYALQTAVIVNRVRREHLMNGMDLPGNNLVFLLLNLILGTEIVTVAAGAKPLPPWRLRSLPQDTWIVDVRSKPEFHWNRLQGAENFPWGIGVIDAAKEKPKDRPVLVMCFSGHRSPPVAVMLRRLGFSTVYNLNWGILYLVLLQRGLKEEGPFSLTRPHRDPRRRGEDVRG